MTEPAAPDDLLERPYPDPEAGDEQNTGYEDPLADGVPADEAEQAEG